MISPFRRVAAVGKVTRKGPDSALGADPADCLTGIARHRSTSVKCAHDSANAAQSCGRNCDKTIVHIGQHRRAFVFPPIAALLWYESTCKNSNSVISDDFLTIGSLGCAIVCGHLRTQWRCLGRGSVRARRRKIASIRSDSRASQAALSVVVSSVRNGQLLENSPRLVKR